MEPPAITFDDFLKVDMRVGRIVQVERFPRARRPAYKLWIDFGALGTKTSSAQITDLYTPESLLHRYVVAVVNFPSRQIANFMSEVLVLGAVPPNHGVVLLHPGEAVPLGTRIG